MRATLVGGFVALGVLFLAVGAAAPQDAGSSPYATAVLADNPRGYWRLGEDTGEPTASDSSGNAFHGSYRDYVDPGADGALSGDPNGAANFEGIPDDGLDEDSVYVGDPPGIDLGTGDFSVEAWVRTTSLGGVIAAKANGPGRCPNPPPKSVPPLRPPGFAVSVAGEAGNEGRVKARIAYDGYVDDLGCWHVSERTAYGPAVRVDDGAWHHVAVVFDRDSGIRIYVDGTVAETLGATPGNMDGVAPFEIGDTDGLTPFGGTIDEPALYGHALTAARIQAHRDAARIFANGPETGSGGDGRATQGVVRTVDGQYEWLLANELGGPPSHVFRFEAAGTPVVGDWDGDGIETPGVVHAGNHWTLTNGYDDVVDLDFVFGNPGDAPVVGDWNGDGIDTVGVRRGTTWHLSNTFVGTVDHVFAFGNPDDVPLAGDWDGDRKDTVGVRRGGQWFLSNDFGGTVHHSFSYGDPGDTAVVGDWNGDEIDAPGVQRGSQWFLSNDFSGTTHHSFAYGVPGDAPVAGDWDSEPSEPEEDVLDGGAGAVGSMSASDPAPATPEVVVRYAPLVYLNEPDGGDRHNPSNVPWFVKRSALRWATETDAPNRLVRGRGRINPRKLGDRSGDYYYARTTHNDDNALITYATWELTRPWEDRPERHGLSLEEGFFIDPIAGTGAGFTDLTQATVYYDYRPRRFIRYWLFYPFSVGAVGFNHEGDWEGVAVDLNGQNEAVRARLYRHGRCDVTVPWTSLEVDEFTGHRVVYSSRGHHATYASAGRHTCGGFFEIVDETAQGARWRTWVRLANVRRQPWYGFGGAWGEVGSRGDSTGPLGPSRYNRPAPAGF